VKGNVMTADAGTLDRLIDATSESFDALISWVEAAQHRAYRVSQALLKEAREADKDRSALARAWIASPARVHENLESMIDAQARAQRRALDFARDSLNSASEHGEEIRDALRRITRANRSAAEAILEAGRTGVSSAVRQVDRAPRPWATRRLPAARPMRVPVIEDETARRAS
jgi:hypothetical protein